MRETITANQGDYLDLGGAREQCAELNYTCPDLLYEYEDQEQWYFATPHLPSNNIDLEDAFESLQRRLHKLNQGMRRIEKRLIDGEDRVAELEAENRYMRRALAEMQGRIANAIGV